MKRKFFLLTLFILAGGISFLLLEYRPYNIGQGNKPEQVLPYYQVKRSKFQIKIVERGTLQARRSFVFSSEIQGNKAEIAKIVLEGTFVKKGELLIQFDQTPFLEDIERLQTEVERAKSEVIQAEEALKTERVKTRSAVAKAEETLRFAELELKGYKEGTGPLMVSKALAAVQRTKKVHQRLARDYEAMKDMLKEGFITRAEMEKMEIRLEEAETSHIFSKREYDTLINYVYPSKLESMTAKVEGARDALEKLKETTKYNLVSKEAAIRRAKANLRSANDRLKLARDQLRKTIIVSPLSGFVIYREHNIGGVKRKLQIGDKVWTGQEILFIPDTSKMLVKTRIREVDIYKIKKGQKAVVRFDSYPDLTIGGKVNFIGTLAKGKEGSEGGIKYFKMEIVLNKTDPRLRPGMTARVEVLVYEEDNVITVPLDALFERQGKSICYVAKGDGYEAREVSSEMSNEDFVLIREGLKDGEKVLLVEPPI